MARIAALPDPDAVSNGEKKDSWAAHHAHGWRLVSHALDRIFLGVFFVLLMMAWVAVLGASLSTTCSGPGLITEDGNGTIEQHFKMMDNKITIR